VTVVEELAVWKPAEAAAELATEPVEATADAELAPELVEGVVDPVMASKSGERVPWANAEPASKRVQIRMRERFIVSSDTLKAGSWPLAK
jgi:hypothetical protein